MPIFADCHMVRLSQVIVRVRGKVRPEPNSDLHDLDRRLRPALMSFFVRRLRNHAEAEELTQEVFLKIHRGRARFVADKGVIAWAYAIARTTHLDLVRQRRRKPLVLLEQSYLETLAATSTSEPETDWTQRSLETSFERNFAGLSESLRSAFILVKLRGMTCADAGAALGVSIHAIKKRVHRATDELKDGISGAHTVKGRSSETRRCALRG